MGRAVPGHRVEVMDLEAKKVCGVGEIGVICVQCPDPVMFLSYWQNVEKTQEKFLRVENEDGDGCTEWLITGDMARKDSEGYFYYDSRDDDIINMGGYRIGQ